jgi:ABC-type transporter MlaC component
MIAGIDPAARRVADGVLVIPRLIRRDREPVRLDYVMREINEATQVIDVYADGAISEFARRRTEFISVLSRDDADSLIARLIQKDQTLIGTAA